MSSTTTPKVNCPNCQAQVLWIEQNAYRPFCSQRCKLIDLGDWAAGNHAIAGEPVIDEELDNDYP